jgi:hypothetical protein
VTVTDSVRKALFVISIVFLLDVSCARQDPTLVHSGLQYPDFNTFPTPRTFDQPGTVFRINRMGNKLPVSLLKVPIHSGKEAFSKYATRESWTLNTLAQFIGLNLGTSLTDSGSYDVTLVLSNGLREWTYDEDLDRSLEKVSISFRKDSRYFVIRETISVTNIDYELSNNAGMSAEIRGILNESIQARTDIVHSSKSLRSLKQVFPAPHRLFYTLDEITTGKVGMFESEAIRRMPVFGTPQWVNETSSAEVKEIEQRE